ncbi:hypothetical protein RBSWK_04517 [Rhodopirellula baltica SWK14]|uniref:Uncharacterized protein n=1 Tax=Rhodopirellula baltica SWK14 TaxID=993516 RepID=L7CBE3_RHOBT|nr:hypothetical protein RBSWK_04517 [Rhodopirellula baltica SWK14]
MSGTWSSFEQPGHFNFIDHHSHRFDPGSFASGTANFSANRIATMKMITQLIDLISGWLSIAARSIAK